MKPKNEFPPGWDEKRVRDLLAHYENQTEEEAVAEDEAAFEHRSTRMVEVPIELLPAVRLIAICECLLFDGALFICKLSITLAYEKVRCVNALRRESNRDLSGRGAPARRVLLRGRVPGGREVLRADLFRPAWGGPDLVRMRPHRAERMSLGADQAGARQRWRAARVRLRGQLPE
jgi:hypothetical protein